MNGKTCIEIIRELREDKDLKQIDIANVIGTSQQHYSKYETGEYDIPLRALILLADYYNVSLDFLTGRTECVQGIDGLKKNIVTDYSVGKLASDVLSLDEAGRRYVVECVGLQKLKAQKKE